jgi:RHS repeat-associated protein
VVAEFDAPGGTSCGALQRSFSWGLDLVGSLEASGGVGALLQIVQHVGPLAGTYLPARDGNGNIVALINATTNEVAASYEYSPFGELLRAEGPYAAANPFRFSSKFTDDETGLVYYGMRHYSPALGRFISRDPIEEDGGTNLYGFCGNNGVSRWDRLGLTPSAGPVQLPPVEVTSTRINDGGFSITLTLGTGVYGSTLGSAGDSSVFVPLKDNSSFTSQAQDVIDAARIRREMVKYGGRIPFEVLTELVRHGIDLAAYVELREAMNAATAVQAAVSTAPGIWGNFMLNLRDALAAPFTLLDGAIDGAGDLAGRLRLMDPTMAKAGLGAVLAALTGGRAGVARGSARVSRAAVSTAERLPGPSLAAKTVSTFENGIYTNRKLLTDETLFKYHGINNRTGRQFTWVSNVKYSTEAEVRAALAIRDNWVPHLTRVSEFRVPAGTWISEGRAAAQGVGYPGGGYQAVIQEVPRSWVVRTDLFP